ncbi:MAG: EamA/RhaT family transporter [Candidatus Methanomethylicota archaeon]|uniref:EamA/RhaT family transporter n=1 Tax=Thermoproteota archaeon TaxID=2056631 RepID=A0A497EUU7_9CREN|nr:MAG: EamA/RhaT family transporter [Candidatus Verstraetearchaeota archaeon]
MQISEKLKAWTSLGIAVISVSFASIIVILSEASGIICALWRLILSSILTWIGVVLTKSEIKFNYRIGLLTFIAGLCLAMHFTFWMESLFMIPVAISTTIVDSHPLFSALLSTLILKEKPRKIQLIGAIIAILGISLLAGISFQIEGKLGFIGLIYALIGAITVAIYFAIGRKLRKIMNTLTYTGMVYSWAAIILLTYSLTIQLNIVNYGFRTWIAFIALAIIPMLLGHSMLNYALKYLSLIAVTTVTLGEPVGASILAKIILNQEIGLNSIIAIIITLIGITLTLIGEQK